MKEGGQNGAETRPGIDIEYPSFVGGHQLITFAFPVAQQI